jgi:hypothetical protein
VLSAFGDYSIKSAYRIWIHNLDSSHLRVNGEWNLLWSIKAPPKVKNLLWRICRCCVMTRVRLRTKVVDCPLVCPLWNAEEDDSKHVFFNCPNSQNVWSMSIFSQEVSSAANSGNDFKTVIFHILQHLSKNYAALFGCILWSIWKQGDN